MNRKTPFLLPVLIQAILFFLLFKETEIKLICIIVSLSAILLYLDEPEMHEWYI